MGKVIWKKGNGLATKKILRKWYTLKNVGKGVSKKYYEGTWDYEYNGEMQKLLRTNETFFGTYYNTKKARFQKQFFRKYFYQVDIRFILFKYIDDFTGKEQIDFYPIIRRYNSLYLYRRTYPLKVMKNIMGDYNVDELTDWVFSDTRDAELSDRIDTEEHRKEVKDFLSKYFKSIFEKEIEKVSTELNIASRPPKKKKKKVKKVSEEIVPTFESFKNSKNI